MAEFSSLNGYAVKDAVARNIAKGRNQAVSFNNYASMITALSAMEKDEYKTGQNIYIGVVGVPDLWVYSVESTMHNFSYVSETDVVDKLTANTTIQVGYYKLAMLEGQKVDLTGHVAKSDIVNSLTSTATNKPLSAAQGKALNDALNTAKSNFQDGCSTIAAAINAMGVSTASNASPSTMAANIKKIKTAPNITAVVGKDGDGKWTADLSGISGFKNLVLYKNIFPVSTNMWIAKTTSSTPISITYNSNTGILTCSTGHSDSKVNAGTCYVVEW